MFNNSLKRVCQVGVPSPYPTYHDVENRIGYGTGGICSDTNKLLVGMTTDWMEVPAVQSTMDLKPNMEFKRICINASLCFPNITVAPQNLTDYRLEYYLTAQTAWDALQKLKTEFPEYKVTAVTDDDPGGNHSVEWSTIFPRKPCKTRSDCAADGMDFLGENGDFVYRCTEDSDKLAYGYISFDTILGAMLTVLQITTLADWGVVSFWLREAEASFVVPLWTMMLICTMTFIVINLNISIVHQVFEKQEKKRATRQQPKPETKEDWLPFEWPGVAFTILYAVSESTRFKKMSSGHESALSSIEVTCLSFLTLELCIRFLLLRFRGKTILSPWNVFDLTVFIASWSNYALHGVSYVLILHMFRLSEVVMHTDSDEQKPLKLLLKCTGRSLLPIANVALFLMFTTAIFAAVSVHAFSGVVPEPPEPCPRLSNPSGYGWAAAESGDIWNTSWMDDSKGCVVQCHATCASYKPWEAPGQQASTGGSTCPTWPPGLNNIAPPENCSTVGVPYISPPVAANTISCPGWDPEVGTPRLNFNSFGVSAVTLFVMTTGDDWVFPLYNLMHCSSDEVVPVALLFFISYFVFTNFVLLNLFTAVAVEQFQLTDVLVGSKKAKEKPDEATKDVDVDQFLLGSRPMSGKRSISPPPLPASSLSKPPDTEEDVGNKQPWFSRSYNCCVFPPTHVNVLRMKEVVRSEWFERLMIFCIFGSCLAALWEPNRPNIPPTCVGSCVDQHMEFQLSDRGTLALLVISVIFTALFSLEALLKMVTNGIAFGPNTYFGSRDHSDKLDFFVLASMVLSLIFAEYRYLKIIRAYRPLRLFNKIQILKVLGSALRRSMKPIGIAIGAGLAVFFIFGVVGMQLFMGKFGKCTDPCVETVASCVGNHETEIEDETILVPRRWKSPHSHFDHIGSTLLTLSEVASMSDWKNVMYNAMDITTEGVQPRYNESPGYALYFISFVFMCGFLLVAIFISIIMENINARRGILFLTPEQNEWIRIRKDVVFESPTLHRDAGTGIGTRIVSHRYFDWFISCSVILNVIILAVGTDGVLAWDVADACCLGIFVVEAVLKIAALSPVTYFRQSNCKVEFLIVVLSVIGTVLDMIPGTDDTRVISSIGKASRIARIFRLTKLNSTLSMFFASFLSSLPSIVNVSALLAILLMVYGYLGGYAFGNVRDRESIYSLCHFRSFGKSFFVMFRALTLDNWNGIMWDVAKSSGCTKQNWVLTPSHPEYARLSAYANDDMEMYFNDCGTPAFSFIFFVSFYILGHYVILDLVVAVVLDCFSTVTRDWERKEKEEELWKADLEIFKDIWGSIDNKNLGVVNQQQLGVLLDRVTIQCSKLSQGVVSGNRTLVVKELENLANRISPVQMMVSAGKARRRSYMNTRGKYKFGFADVLQVTAMYSVGGSWLTPQALRQRTAVRLELYCQLSCDVLLKYARGFLVRARLRSWLRNYNVKLCGGFPDCSHSVARCRCWLHVHTQVGKLKRYRKESFYHNIQYNLPLVRQAPLSYKETFYRMKVRNNPNWIPESVSIPEGSFLLHHSTHTATHSVPTVVKDDDSLFGDLDLLCLPETEESVDEVEMLLMELLDSKPARQDRSPSPGKIEPVKKETNIFAELL
eukprot:TRINITY_DN13619_c0_g1_i2.p1 TRINITY_DN13619_c0_g1~~TRINITY_DN13619_c0_g1_i2.p1  ORF type:complete len:1611 (+),score=173.13 TRINITY_DN13619_c0_g1_i2:619-5451(+)